MYMYVSDRVSVPLRVVGVVFTDRVSGPPSSVRRSCSNHDGTNVTTTQIKTGDTYFLRADETPTTRLESVARSIFDFHTVRVRRVYGVWIDLRSINL